MDIIDRYRPVLSGGGCLALLAFEPAGTTCLRSPGHAVRAPIAADGSSVFQHHRPVAVNFRVCDALGVSIGTPGVVSTFRLVEIVTGTQSRVVDQTPLSASRATAFAWEPGPQMWTFNVETADLVPGATYVYSIDLNDGTSIGFRFAVR